MKIQFYATLRQLTGNKQVELDYPHGATLGQVLDRVIEEFPDLSLALIDENGTLYRHVHIIVNGRDISLDVDRETILGPGESISIFPAIGGG